MVYYITYKQALAGARPREAKQAAIDEIKILIEYSVGYDEIKILIEYSVGYFTKWEDILRHKRFEIIPTFMFVVGKHFPDGGYDKTKARIVGNGARLRGSQHGKSVCGVLHAQCSVVL